MEKLEPKPLIAKTSETKIHKEFIGGKPKEGEKVISSPTEVFVDYIPDADPLTTAELADEFENQTWASLHAKELQRIRKEKEEQKRIESEIEKTLPTYSLQEFRFLEAAFKYKNLADKIPALTKTLPRFDAPPGSKEPPKYLSLAQIKKEARKYNEIMRNPKLKDQYSERELQLTQRAAAWQFLYNKVKKMEAYPEVRWLEGGKEFSRPLTYRELKEQAQKYKEFYQEKPAEFAEMKVMAGEWFKRVFHNWQKDKINNKIVWRAEKIITIKDPKTKETKKVTVKYIVNNPPPNFKPKVDKEYFYNIAGQSKKGEYYINIKAPY